MYRYAIIIGGTSERDVTVQVEELLAAAVATMRVVGVEVTEARKQVMTERDLIQEEHARRDTDARSAKAAAKAEREAMLAARDAAEKYTPPLGEPTTISAIKIEAIRNGEDPVETIRRIAAERERLDEMLRRDAEEP